MPMPRFLTSSVVPFVVAALAVGTLLAQEVTAPSVLRYAGYLLVAIGLPGVFAWRWLLRSLHGEDGPSWFEDIALGTIFGFTLQLPVYLVGVATGHALLVLVLPVAVVVLALTPGGRAVWTLPTGRLDARVGWVLAAVSVYAAAWVDRVVALRWPLSMSQNKTLSIDETYHLALIAELSHRMPPETPYLHGAALQYHWFVHAQLAATRWVTDLESLVLMRAFLPTMAAVLTVTGVAAVALRLTRRPLAAAVAPALLTAGAFHLMGPDFDAGMVTEPFLSRRYVSSSSHSYSLMLSLPAVLLVLEVLRPGRRARATVWVALAVSLLGVGGAKPTFLPIFLCGAIAAWGVQLLVRRRVDRAATGLVGVLAATFAFHQVVLYGGKSGGLFLIPLMPPEILLLQQGAEVDGTTMTVSTVAILVAWLLYGVGLVGLFRQRRWLDPRAVFMVVSILAGLTVGMIFMQAGNAPLWFQRAVSPLVVLLSVWGLVHLLPEPLTRRAGAALAGVALAAGVGGYAFARYLSGLDDESPTGGFAAVLATALVPFVVLAVTLLAVLVRRVSGRPGRGPGVVAVVFLLGVGLIQVLSFTGKVLTEPVEPAASGDLFAPGGISAARYVERRSTPDQVVATNVHCAVPGVRRCDNRTFWVSAYTERRVLVEGWGYAYATLENSVEGQPIALIPVPFPELLATNDAAFESPSARTLDALVEEYDVSWLFVSKLHPVDLAGLEALPDRVSKEFENENYAVFRVLD